MPGVDRPSLMRSYVDNQVRFLKTKFAHLCPLKPASAIEAFDARIEQFVLDQVHRDIRRPKVTNITHTAYGKYELREVDLLDHIKAIRTKVITPFGGVYETSDIHEAFDKRMVDGMLTRRSTVKKEMLDAQAAGRILTAMLKDYEQSLVKININSIIGGHGNENNAMYDKEGFNAITSLSRGAVMLAYTYVERCLEGNFYFPTIEYVYNYITTTLHYCPAAETIERVLRKHKLMQPLPGDVCDFLLENLRQYQPNYPGAELFQMLSNLQLHELAFLFYNRNLKHLLQCNSLVFRPWIARFMSEEGVDLTPDVDPKELYKLDGDLAQIVATVHNKYLNGRQIFKTPDEDPATAKIMIHLGRHMQAILDEKQDLFDVFLHSDTFIPQIEEQKEMFRRTVIISDTDSVIFTTKSWVDWYLESNFKFCDETYQIHSLIIYLISKSIATIIQTMSRHRGAVGPNIKRMEIKNEYLYPVLIRCEIRKHYAGRITIQEGRILPMPKMDIKGVNFRSSTLPKVTLAEVESTICSMLDEILEHTNLYAGDYITRAHRYEANIFASLEKGELTYIGTTSLKYKNEYKDPEKTVYANYLIWEEVFAPKYGSIPIPAKVPLVPLVKNAIKHPVYLNWLQQYDPEVYERLMRFLQSDAGAKDITRLPIGPELGEIPKELVSLINKRSIVFKNMAPIMLALRSIGVNLGNGTKNSKRNLLLRDVYGGEADQTSPVNLEAIPA